MLLLSLKNKYKNNETGISFNKDVKMSDIINDLPFKLTKAQLRVLEEIDNDLYIDTNDREYENIENQFLKEEDGMGTVEVVLIIVVLIALVAMFRDGIKSVLETILKTVKTNAKAI